MDSSVWRLAFEIFNGAIARGGIDRQRWLDSMCTDDQLRDAVAALIRAHEAAPDFLEVPAAVQALGRGAIAPGELPPGEPGTFASNLFDTGSLIADALGPLAPIHSSRFTLRRMIGAGGMGIVYEAYDRDRSEVVALKTIRQASPAQVYFLKREFRALADIAHPNLVTLYELVVEDPSCFFTMELIDGLDVVHAVRGTDGRPRFEQIRGVFGQIADAVTELHRHRRLHRDLKPSNVLVTGDGRVVVLDFGLITSADHRPHPGVRAAGTPAYMAPEDLAGGSASQASDWYSVGVTLYEALTGLLPFSGSSFEEQQRAKSAGEVPAPASRAEGVPADLNEICIDLLSFDRDRRGAGWQRLLAPSTRTATRATSALQAGVVTDVEFVGRGAAVAAIDRAFDVLCARTAVSVLVEGPAGIGKSALVQHCLRRLPVSASAVVLRGRCYEREAVPYQALDGILDSLHEYLAGLTPAERAELMPDDRLALAHAFPLVVIDRDTHAETATTSPVDDPVTLRRRGLAALRQLFGNLARCTRLILFVDDLHWADADSSAVLMQLIGPPVPLPILTVLCFRSEESASKPFLQALCATAADPIAIRLEAFNEAESAALVESVSVERTLSPAEMARIGDEAKGNPLVIKQIAYFVDRLGQDHVRPLTFNAMLRTRVDLLPEEARIFLDTLVVSGRPTSPHVIHRACGGAGDEHALVGGLRAAHLVRSSGSAARVEVYHDRIRGALVDVIPPDRVKNIHRAIAQSLEASPDPDPEELFEHFAGADDAPRAAVYAVASAERANAALAFERSAYFYRRALASTPEAGDAGTWRRRLAEALANAGRPREAGEIYLEAAASSVDEGERIGLRRRASEQLMAGGYIDRGVAVLESVLEAANLPRPRGPRAAFVSLVAARLALAARGLAIKKPPTAIPASVLQRIDTCWSAVTGLAMIDPIRSADYQARHLRLALEAGEPYRVARALALQIGFEAAGHGLLGKRAFVDAEDALAAAERLGDPHLVALVSLTTGMRAVIQGEWRRAAPLCDRALALLHEHLAGATWEINLANFFLIGSLLYLGELKRVSARLPELLESARERGNLFFETEMRTRMNLVWLIADEPEEGARQAQDAIRTWAQRGFQRQHYNLALALVQTALYQGHAEEAWDRLDSSWRPMKRTFLLRIPTMRMETFYMRARCALQMASHGLGTRRFLAIARRDIASIEAEGLIWSSPLAALLRAGAASVEQDSATAEGWLDTAATSFDEQGMQLYAATARRRLGELLGGSRGRDLISAADAWMHAQGVKQPSAIARLLAPGFADH